MNFNKLLSGDEVSISVEGIRKPAVIRVVDPFQELLTVEYGNEELIASFRDVLPPPEQPTPDTVKRRKPAASPQAAPAATTPTPESAPVSVQSAIAPQFATIVRLDGSKISCGDLVSLTPNSADVVFIVLELYKDKSGFEVLLNAQKCQFSDGVAVRLLANFRLTCPASAVHTPQDTKLSSQLKKAVLETDKEPSCGCPSPCSYTWPTAPISFKFGGTTWQPSSAATEECLPRQLAPSSSKWAQLIFATILNYLG